MPKQIPQSTTPHELIPVETIERRIFLIRGQKVMLDSDLAELYGVETFNLNKAVKRNLDRFPSDFMFQLTDPEFKLLTFQIGISKPSHGAAPLEIPARPLLQSDSRHYPARGDLKSQEPE